MQDGKDGKALAADGSYLPVNVSRACWVDVEVEAELLYVMLAGICPGTITLSTGQKVDSTLHGHFRSYKTL